MILSNKHANKRTQKAFDAAVAMIGCEPEALRAVIDVEARNRGYDAHGRLVSLFEPHKFYALLQKHAPGKLAAAVAKGLAYPQWGERPYPKDSYPRILEAMRIDEELALQATSWGLPQILGSNYADAGYKSAADMVTSFLIGEDEQLTAMAKLVVAWGLSGALVKKDWAAFARKYNGPKYARNAYDAKLAKAYAAAKRRGVAVEAAKAGSAGVVVASGAAVAINEAGGDWVAMAVAGGFVALIVLAVFVIAKLNKSAKVAPAPAGPSLADLVEAIREQNRLIERLATEVAAFERREETKTPDAGLHLSVPPLPSEGAADVSR